ncbi:MAG: hypothetical protein J6I45_08405 [Clostridia bacterium]|nr:hypothetical protein [Clostridia bacterium]
MKHKKLLAVLTMVCILFCCVAVVAHAYQADYVSGSAGHGVTGSGGLYISDGDFSTSASADTSISSVNAYRILSVSVYIDPNNPNIEDGDYADNSYSGNDYIQVNASTGTIYNGAEAGGTHSIYFIDSDGRYGSWGDSTFWSN